MNGEYQEHFIRDQREIQGYLNENGYQEPRDDLDAMIDEVINIVNTNADDMMIGNI